MSLLGNILWLIFGGFICGLAWLLAGVILCITVIGIPFGLQCFKIAGLAFCPFGRDVVYGGGAGSFIVNVIWLIFFGVWIAIGDIIDGLILSVTKIGIHLGLQFFKLAKLSLMPFGARIV